nr:hypothetical protein [[Eubacterium] cellulosolvens]
MRKELANFEGCSYYGAVEEASCISYGAFCVIEIPEEFLIT